jgi:hypothetical protein
MTWETTYEAISGRFNTQVEVPQGITVQYDNESPQDPPQGQTWVRFTVRPGNSDSVEYGSTILYRLQGIAIAQIFTPLGIGDAAALQLADVIKTAFRTTFASPVKFLVPTIATIGRDASDSDWWQTNVIIPWFANEQA